MKLQSASCAILLALTTVFLATVPTLAHHPHEDHDLQRLTVYVKKLDNLTYDQFYDHWINVHAQKVGPWVVKNGLRGYTQVALFLNLRPSWQRADRPCKYHTRPELKAQWPGSTVPYDGFATFDLKNVSQFFNAVVQDPYYVEVIRPDELTFLDESASGQ